MKPSAMLVLATVAAAVIAVLLLKPDRNVAPPAQPPPIPVAKAAAPLPRLLDLGASTCTPCRMMTPILDELKASLAGVLHVDFIDVRLDRSAAQAYGIATIPTQIFFAPDGREVFRHEGFLAREDILARWKALGYDLSPAPAGPQHPGRVAP